ncbi:MAG: hypothetical protein U9M90_01530 [Patescibacteria group bacterium]|nr:hypothetical protein [Patescibacteria group bacterium]
MIKQKKILFTGCAIVTVAMLMFFAVSFTERKIEYKTAGNVFADIGCPSTGDWVDIGDFCIMEDEEGSSDTWEDAGRECSTSAQDSRLCTSAEWTVACLLDANGSISLDNITGDNDEWVGDLETTNNAAVIGDTGCQIFGNAQTGSGGDSRNFRCCVNKQY